MERSNRVGYELNFFKRNAVSADMNRLLLAILFSCGLSVDPDVYLSMNQPKRLSTREFIRDTLLGRIFDGTYPPGYRLIELQIAQELGTSQGPVREAFRDLEASGLVESRTYKGTRVRIFTDEEIEHSYQVRSVLEQLAAELAAPKLKGKTAQLKIELDKFMAAARVRDVKTYSHHDMDFHRLILKAAGNPLLSQLWDQVALESRFIATIRQRIGEDELERLAAAHAPILDALEAGDAAEAGKRARHLICTFHARKQTNKDDHHEH